MYPLTPTANFAHKIDTCQYEASQGLHHTQSVSFVNQYFAPTPTPISISWARIVHNWAMTSRVQVTSIVVTPCRIESIQTEYSCL